MENVTSQGSRGEPVSHHQATSQSLERSAPAKRGAMELGFGAPGPISPQPGRCHRALASASLLALGKHEVGKGRVRHTPRRKFRSGSLEKWIGNQRTAPKAPAGRGSGNPHPAPRTALTAVTRPRRRAREPSVPPLAHALGGARRGERARASQQRRTRSRQSRAPALQRPRRRAGTHYARARGWRGRGRPGPARLPASQQPARPRRLPVPTGARPPPARLGSAEGPRSREAP